MSERRDLKRFDFEAAVKEAYRQFPTVEQHIFFINTHAKDHKIVHPNPKVRPRLVALVNENEDLRKDLNTQIWKHNREHASSVMMRGKGEHTGFWVFLYLENNMQSALKKNSDRDQNKFLVFDHEFAHALISQAHGVKLLSESTADVYAAIRHFQRFGTNTGTIEKLVKRRAALGFINQDGDHFTSPALATLLAVKDQMDFNKMTPGETVAFAEYVAKLGAMKKDNIRRLSRHFGKLAKPMRDPKGDQPLRVLADMWDKARSPDLKTWGGVVLRAFLDNDITLDTAKGKLNTPYWNKMRAKLGPG